MQCYWPIAEPLIGDANVDTTKLNQWQKLSWRNVRADWNDNQTAQFRFDFEGMASNTIAYIDDAMLIDLTAAFGAGNEPTQEWCDTNIEYFSGNKTIQYEAPNKYDLTVTTPTKIQTGDILNCPYSGSMKSVILPKGQYKLECWGAQGGYRSSSSYGGNGGYSVGILNLTQKTTVYLYAGGAGNTGKTAGGFNGGGKRDSYNGGGGGTDIRIGSDSLYARVIVAGGGGSDGASDKNGMYGGGTSGGTTIQNYGSGGGGGTQTTGGTGGNSNNNAGTFGQGGSGLSSSSGYGGAGGGGWYGGGGSFPDYSGDDDRGGGGGSGYIYTSSTASSYPSGCLLNSSYYLTNAITVTGNTAFTSPTGANETGHTGNGYVRITVIKTGSGNTLVKIPSSLPAAYNPIEYLQFTGTQYINTGVTVDSNTGFDITFEVLNGQSSSPYYNLFGVRGNDSSGGTGETQNFFRIDTIPVNSNSGTEFKYGSTTYNSGIKDTSKINIKLLNKVYTKPDGSTITVAGTITSGLSMYIGCINKAGAAYGNLASMKIYRFKIYNGSILAHDFIPVQRVSDKVLGLYDLKTSTFKTNMASGVFTSNLMNDPSSLAYFNGDSLQSQGNSSLTITKNNVTLSNEQTHFGKNSLKFDGSSSYMYMPFPSTYTGDITLEGWFYQTSNNNVTYPTPFTLISSAGRGFYMHRSSSQTFVAATPSNSWPGLTGGTTALNTWTHIAMCLSGTTTYCFLDGKLKGTLTNTNTSYVGLTLGTLAESASNNHASGCYYKGYIAELKITKGCKWTKDFTLPTASYGTAKDSTPWKEPVQMFVNIGASSTISSGLVELDYIESTGTQYIDTGFKPNGNSGIIIDYQQVGTIANRDALFGARQSSNNAAFATWLSSNTTYPQYGNVSYNTKPISITNNTRLIYKLDKGKASCGDKSVSFTQSSFSSNCNLTLFAINTKDAIDSRRVSGKLYSCKVYDNGALIRDFIPAKRTSDSKCGLWDKINYKFYTDESGGNFTAGTEKTTIAAIGTPIEYIQSSGTQYINSGFIPKATTRTIMKAEPMSWSAWSAFFGTRNATSPTASQAYIAAVPAATLYCSDYFGSSLTAETFTIMQITNIDKNKNICSFNNIMITNTSSTVNATTNMFLLALNDVGTAKYFLSAKLYSCKIYDGDTLVRDFIPIKTTVNTYGLWDKVNKVFYKNAGTGTFTGGPAVTLTGWHKIKGVWAKTATNTWSQTL